MAHDLILRGGHVIDTSQDIDQVADVAFSGGKVSAVGGGLEAGADTGVRDVYGNRSEARGVGEEWCWKCWI